MGIVWVRFGYLGPDKMKKPLIYKGSCGGRNRTRTYDPIDVNDVPSIVLCITKQEKSRPKEAVNQSIQEAIFDMASQQFGSRNCWAVSLNFTVISYDKSIAAMTRLIFYSLYFVAISIIDTDN